MVIDKIICLANESTRLMFLAMERSLRAVGSDLPLYVIPYDDRKFELPKNAFWLEDAEFFDWVAKSCAHPTMRKYLSLTAGNYQYIDTDAIFLQNPEPILAPYEGVVMCDTEWNKPVATVTPGSQAVLSRRWSTWQKEVFSTGQHACDRPLYTCDEIRAFSELPEHREACMDFVEHEQPGLNLLVLLADVPRINLTLPPVNMESSWAGDYPELPSWNDSQLQPYIMHYAGGILDKNDAVNELFYQYWSQSELSQWKESVAIRKAREAATPNTNPIPIRALNRIVRTLYPEFRVKKEEA